MIESEVTVRLTVAEFVVLDEFLRRFTLQGKLAIEHKAEWYALNNLEAVFEREPSRCDSWPSLEEARASLMFSSDDE